MLKSSLNKHFIAFFKENLLQNFYSLRTPLVFIGGAIFFILRLGWENFLESFNPPWIWLILVGALFVDALLTAAGMHFYVRSNRYKRQQERANKTERDE